MGSAQEDSYLNEGHGDCLRNGGPVSEIRHRYPVRGQRYSNRREASLDRPHSNYLTFPETSEMILFASVLAVVDDPQSDHAFHPSRDVASTTGKHGPIEGFCVSVGRQLVRVKGESWGEPQSWGSPERRNGWRRQRPRTNGYRVSAAPMGRLIEGAPASAVLGMAGCAHRKAGE